MYLTSLPLVLSSLTFAIPYFAAVETDNLRTAICWGALACTSTFVHLTKRPYHLYGDGNCIPWLYTLDVAVLYVAVVRALIDGWYGGWLGIFMSVSIISYAAVVFYTGGRRFVYDTQLDMSILSHLSVHLLASFGGTGVIYMRAFKNGHELSKL
jgi:hypothetical protein